MNTHLFGGRAALRIPTPPPAPVTADFSAIALDTSRHLDGKDIVFVYLRNVGRNATLYRKDYDRVVAEIGNGRWMLNTFTQPNGTGRAYVRAKAAGQLTMIARIVAEAPPRTAVRYRDGDPLNLRSENLFTDTAGGAGGCKKRRKGTVNALENRAKVRAARNGR